MTRAAAFVPRRDEEMRALEDGIAPVREALLQHPIYRLIGDVDALKGFMRYHVFAVWDFMSLLKSLQRDLTTVTIPWVPPRSTDTARLINEIVLAEESDFVEDVGYQSHLELYLGSMDEIGADRSQADEFIGAVASGESPGEALGRLGVPKAAALFVEHTLATATYGRTHEKAAAFLLGREDLIPSMFERLLAEVEARCDGRCTRFRYYLERHVKLDGEQHGPLSKRLLANLCGGDLQRWAEAASAARASMEARLALWDGVVDDLGARGGR